MKQKRGEEEGVGREDEGKEGREDGEVELGWKGVELIFPSHRQIWRQARGLE